MPARDFQTASGEDVVLESGIPASFDKEDPTTGDVLRILSNFTATNEKCQLTGLEDIERTGRLFFEGKLVDPESLETKLNVTLNATQLWAYDYSLENQGIWIKTEGTVNGGGVWYKLLDPSDRYHPIYSPFQQKANIWIKVFRLLLDHKDENPPYETIISEFTVFYKLEDILQIEMIEFIMRYLQREDEMRQSSFCNEQFATTLKQKLEELKKQEKEKEKQKKKKIATTKKTEAAAAAAAASPKKISTRSSTRAVKKEEIAEPEKVVVAAAANSSTSTSTVSVKEELKKPTPSASETTGATTTTTAAPAPTATAPKTSPKKATKPRKETTEKKATTKKATPKLFDINKCTICQEFGEMVTCINWSLAAQSCGVQYCRTCLEGMGYDDVDRFVEEYGPKFMCATCMDLPHDKLPALYKKPEPKAPSASKSKKKAAPKKKETSYPRVEVKKQTTTEAVKKESKPKVKREREVEPETPVEDSQRRSLRLKSKSSTSASSAADVAPPTKKKKR